MGDEKERADDLAPRDNPEHPGETESSETEEIVRLTNLAAKKDEELLVISRRMEELTRMARSKGEELSALKQSVAETEEKLASTGSSLNKAVAGYRRALTEANPDIVADLITGDSLEAIDQSLEQAKTLVSRVKEGLENQFSLARIPAGAPERTAPDLSSLSPREKIQYAVNRK